MKWAQAEHHTSSLVRGWDPTKKRKLGELAINGDTSIAFNLKFYISCQSRFFPKFPPNKKYDGAEGSPTLTWASVYSK